jgi:hypothetical protein
MCQAAMRVRGSRAIAGVRFGVYGRYTNAIHVVAEVVLFSRRRFMVAIRGCHGHAPRQGQHEQQQ